MRYWKRNSLLDWLNFQKIPFWQLNLSIPQKNWNWWNIVRKQNITNAENLTSDTGKIGTHTITHTHTHTNPVGLLQTSDQLVADPAIHTAHNKQKRRMTTREFEPAFPAIKSLQTYDLDRTATGIGDQYIRVNNYCQHRYRSTVLHMTVLLIVSLSNTSKRWRAVRQHAGWQPGPLHTSKQVMTKYQQRFATPVLFDHVQKITSPFCAMRKAR